ncbi:G2/mitotic-specific cyclin-1 [Trifolium repens]|nr:G2/mitotic-specific cyclin-1 [Trifolium repens]
MRRRFIRLRFLWTRVISQTQSTPQIFKKMKVSEDKSSISNSINPTNFQGALDSRKHGQKMRFVRRSKRIRGIDPLIGGLLQKLLQAHKNLMLRELPKGQTWEFQMD